MQYTYTACFYKANSATQTTRRVCFTSCTRVSSELNLFLAPNEPRWSSPGSGPRTPFADAFGTVTPEWDRCVLTCLNKPHQEAKHAKKRVRFKQNKHCNPQNVSFDLCRFHHFALRHIHGKQAVTSRPDPHTAITRTDLLLSFQALCVLKLQLRDKNDSQTQTRTKSRGRNYSVM